MKKIINFIKNLFYLSPKEVGKKIGLKQQTMIVVANYEGDSISGEIVGKQKSRFTGDTYVTISLEKPKKINGSWRWHVSVKEDDILGYKKHG